MHATVERKLLLQLIPSAIRRLDLPEQLPRQVQPQLPEQPPIQDNLPHLHRKYPAIPPFPPPHRPPPPQHLRQLPNQLVRCPGKLSLRCLPRFQLLVPYNWNPLFNSKYGKVMKRIIHTDRSSVHHLGSETAFGKQGQSKSAWSLTRSKVSCLSLNLPILHRVCPSCLPKLTDYHLKQAGKLPNPCDQSQSYTGGSPRQSAAPNSDLDAKLAHLVGFGFSREQSLEALNKSNGNLEYAAALLFEG